MNQDPAIPNDLTEAGLEQAFLAEQVSLQAAESRRIPLGVTGVSAVLAYGASTETHPLGPLIWFAIVNGLLVLRVIMADRFSKSLVSPDQMRLWLWRFSVANGVTMGLGVAIFMHWYDLQWQSVATIFLLGLIAGTVPASALLWRHFRAYAFPVAGFLALGWTFFGATEPRLLGIMIGLLVLAYLFVFAAFSRDAEARAQAGFAMRYENARLVKALQAKQAEVTHERDVAEKASLAKSRFLASASHDLRQPLQTIAMYQAALSLRNIGAESEPIVKRMGAAITSLTSLLNALLDVSQMDTASMNAHLTPVSLSRLIERLGTEYSQIAESRHLKLEVFADPHLRVQADEAMLERVLRNLLDNAIKHGAIRTVRLTAWTSDQRNAELEVFDDGGAIPPQETEAIFEEFYQLRNPDRDRARGIGLGLAIVRRLCEKMGISCTVNSQPGATRFMLGLPLTDQALPDAPAEAAEPAASSALEGLRVLVLDDETEVRDALATLLGSWGCRVGVTGDAGQAATMLNEGRYQVLLIDLRLRDGQSGLHFLEERIALLGHAAAILITGDASESVSSRAEALGIPVMRKPVRPKDLRQMLEKIVLR